MNVTRVQRTKDCVDGENKLIVGVARARYVDTTLKMDEVHITRNIWMRQEYPCLYQGFNIHIWSGPLLQGLYL